MKLAQTYQFLKTDLNEIELKLHQIIQADHPVLRKASTQLLEAGGKRIRPVFVLLSGHFGHYNFNRLLTVAVSLELIHMATLVHDDVVDDAALRRGEPTVKHRYGNRVAMYTGDYMLARALENITLLNDPALHQQLAKTLVEVCVGEIEQIKYKYHWDQHIRDYLRRIKRKTALLIATSCKLGAIASGASREDAKNLFKYGYYIGMSYQIIDDILDITESEKTLGKPTASDLLQGNVTLPVLLAMKQPSFKEMLTETFQNRESVDPDRFQRLHEMLLATNAVEKSYAWSQLYLQKAINILDKLPDHEVKQTLHDIASYIGKRKK